MIDNIEGTNAAVWAVVAIGMVAALLGVSVILALREHGLLPFRRIAMLRRRSLAEIALVAAVVGGFVHHGATKTNDYVRSGNESLSPAEVQRAEGI